VEIPTTISTIGSRAFEGTGLTTVTLPESVEAVGADALAANSLTEVTIENDQAVVTGIDSSGIVENAIMYVPQSVLSNYEENTPTLLAKGVELRGVAAAVTLTAVRSDNDDYGYYMATDSNGNVWYFNLGSFGYGPSWNQHIGPYSSSSEYFNYSWNTDNTNGTQAVITQFLRYDWITSLYEYSDLAVVVPSFFTSNLFSGAKSVTGLGIGLDYGVYPFSNDYKICSVTLPNTLIGIGEYFFRYYSGLNIIIPSSVKIICDNAFQDSSITSIDISSVEYLGYCIFERCTNLQEITLSNSLTYIPSTILYDCTSLTSITLPSTITKIDIAAFDGCSELANITIDSSTIAALDESNSCLLDYATTVYVLNGLTVGDYIGEWGHTTQSDKAGYVKYVKNS
ncbi:MAG: leucine-rich repeat protein, partial [Clostridia bacterium]|nr:leucine-rich repeat protein [Clostridia bacterium]